jgi:hypothetical protein
MKTLAFDQSRNNALSANCPIQRQQQTKQLMAESVSFCRTAS